MNLKNVIAVNVIALAVACPSALAGLSSPEVEMTVAVNGLTEWLAFPAGEHMGGDAWYYEGVYSHHTGWGIDYEAMIHTDPSIDLDFSFVNDTGSTQFFSVMIVLPIDPILEQTVIGGSVSGATTDFSEDGEGGVSAPNDGAYYNAIVDGSVVRTLHDDLNVGYDFAGDTALIPDEDFGLPGPSELGPAQALNHIGIRIDFFLSAGDSIASTSFFVLEPLPAPGAIALLGVAGLLGGRRRR